MKCKYCNKESVAFIPIEYRKYTHDGKIFGLYNTKKVYIPVCEEHFEKEIRGWKKDKW